MKLHALPRNLRSLAFVAVCGATLSTMPMLAQDNSAPPPPAQDGQGPPQGGHRDPAQMQARQLQMMTKRLNLSPDQVTQIKAIDDDQMTQVQALRSDTSTSRDDKRPKMMAIHQASTEKIRAVLNDEQKTKFDAMEAHRRDRMQGGGDGQGAPPPPPQQ